MRSTGISQTKKSDIGKSYVFYETLKTNLVQFPPKPLTRGTRTRSQDVNTRKLMIQINDLETHKRISQEKLKIYENQIDELTDHLTRINSINKQLLNSKLTVNPADVEIIVSELQNSDIRSKLGQYIVENDKYKSEMESLRSQIEKLQKENKLLEDQKVENLKSGNINETLSMKSIDERLSTPRINISRGLDKYRFGVKNLQMLHKALSDMSSSPNFISLLTSLAIGIKRTLDCERCSIFLVSNFIQRLYLDINDPQNPVQKININGTWMITHNDVNINNEPPVFTHLDEAINGIRSGQDLVEPAVLNKEVALIVQCQLSSKGMFEQTDEVQLRIILELCISCIKSFIGRRREDSLQDQLLEVTNVCAALARARTYHYLASTVNSLLPGFFDFEAAELLYIDEETSEFYGISHNQTLQKFPLKIGLTGEAYASRSMKIYDSFCKKEVICDIDNFAGISEVHNLIIVCLPGPNRTILGVLQLYNKINNNISPKDIQIVGEMSILLGSVIAMLSQINS
ncbi:hypothetical protein SteCoe_690 [Stentor coeruleus]|uniref:GAF domain-containing protein n=1 Tax=Stentor coeruleus TaxID=5963 RepID=A0A1R2D3G4_9CILI|nr:hypothetical protein SteCoe_690 [Stentor coeruleus]